MSINGSTAPSPLARLFAFSARVDRRTYAAWGFGLTLFKYLADALIVWLVAGVLWTPLDYVNPLFSGRQEALGDISAWFQIGMALWSLPFLWIGVSMTMRRALDADLSPWFAVLFFVPLINYLLMLLFCVLPSGPRPGPVALDTHPRDPAARLERADTILGKLIAAVGLSALIPVLGVAVAGQVFESYAFSVFLALPFLLGASAGFLFNRPVVQPLSTTLGVAALALLVSAGFLLGFALEGVLCLAMVLPIAAVVVCLGAAFGRVVAGARRPDGAAAAGVAPLGLGLLLVPLGAWVEKRLERPAGFEARSSVVIAASPAEVWPNVIAFRELDEPRWALFRLGIAYPVRAVIEGEGVGAVRHCEFSTGPFVEPITVWEPPSAARPDGRLAFDVRSHPAPMHEWSPYRGLAPPHLDEFFRSVRGEFRLVALPDGRTRLEGSTWYELRLRPAGYWRLWSDWLVHRIHGRVFEAIRAQTEAPGIGG